MIKKKFAAALVLSGALMLSACGNGADDVSAKPSASTEPSASADQAVPADVLESISEDEPAQAEDYKSEAPVTIVNEKQDCTHSFATLFSTECSLYYLNSETADKYPLLAKTLKEVNDETRQIVKTNVDDCVRDAYALFKDAGSDAPLPYTYSSLGDISRFDDRLFVISTYIDEYYGGAHGMYYKHYVNIDVNSGKRLTASDLITDKDGAVDAICKRLREDYDGVIDETLMYETSLESFVKKSVDNDSIDITMVNGYVEVYYPVYSFGSYAAGDYQIQLSPEDCPGVFNGEYTEDTSGDIIFETARQERKAGDITYDGPEENYISVSCPSWDHYTDGKHEAEEMHTTIDLVHKEVMEPMLTDDWAYAEGYDVQGAFYTRDDGVSFSLENPVDYFYDYQSLSIYDTNADKKYIYYLGELANGPDKAKNKTSRASMNQYVQYACEQNGVVYVELMFNGYSSEEPNTAYICAFDKESGEVIWKSDPLVANAENFIVTESSVICGYGFTDEDDYLYELDIQTGETVDRIKLDKKPDVFVRDGSRLTVWAYDTEYEFRVAEG